MKSYIKYLILVIGYITTLALVVTGESNTSIIAAILTICSALCAALIELIENL